MECAAFGAFKGGLIIAYLRVSIYATFTRYSRATRTSMGLGLSTLVSFIISKTFNAAYGG